jgi:hypothetical protein
VFPRYDEGGKLLCLTVQQVERAINFFEEIPYAADEKLEKLKKVHAELKSEYLVTHLQRFDIISNVFHCFLHL